MSSTEKLLEERLGIFKLAKLITFNKTDDLIRSFNGSISALIAYRSEIGTVAHMCVYLRNIAVLRTIARRFDDHRLLVEWLDTPDRNGRTALDIVSRYEFREFYAYLAAISDSGDRSQDFVLKEGVLQKYTNVVNGYKDRRARLTLDTFSYYKNDVENSCFSIKVADLLIRSDGSTRFVLKSKKSDNEFIFRGGDAGEWVDLIQNLVEAKNRDFYYKNLMFKLLYEMVVDVDPMIGFLMKKSCLYPYYVKESGLYLNQSGTNSSELVREVKEVVERNVFVDVPEFIEKNDEEEYEFFEAREK